MSIKVYRKDSTSKPVAKLAANKRNEIERIIGIRARVQRPSLLAHFMPASNGKSSFHRQDSLPAAVIDNRPERIINHSDKGWVIPSDSLGRKGNADASQAQSILLWVKQHIVANGLASADEISIVVEDD